MKIYKKEDCEYKGGYIVCGDEVVCVSNVVVSLLNKLDLDLQRASFKARTRVKPVTPEEFEQDSEHKPKISVTVATPLLDEKIKQTEELMEELDRYDRIDKAKARIKALDPVVQFLADDFIVSHDNCYQERFDLPWLGSPLEMTIDGMLEVVEMLDV